MRKALLFCSCLFICFAAIARENNTPTPESFANKKALLSFMENKGQITDQNYQPRPDIQFQLKAANGLTIFVGDGAIHYQFAKADRIPEPRKPEDRFDPKKMMEHDSTTFTMYRMDVELIGANKHAKIITEDKQDYYENYYTTGTGENGVMVYAYSKITYKDIYPNIDWVLYTKNNELKHEFIVKQGGNPADIKLKYGGATNLQLHKDGILEAITPQGTITEQAPVSYTREGQKVTSSFSLKENVLSYEVGVYEGTLVIDPSLVWGTYYGGSGYDRGIGINSDLSGNIFVTGRTQSLSGIATTGTYQTTYVGGIDAFIVKFSTSGIRQWGTYYGGSLEDEGSSIALDASDNIVLTGYTTSTSGIATTGAHQIIYGGGGYDAFIVKFSGTGVRQWGTYYGGSLTDEGNSISIDALGNYVVTGYTNSISGIATTGAYQTTNGGGGDVFIVKFNALGICQWGTYYGGSNVDIGYGISIDASSNIIVSGATKSTSGIATVGSYKATGGGNYYYDAFVVKFNSSGIRQWGTYYGGSSDEQSLGNSIDDLGNIIVIGWTQSASGIATSGAFQTSFGGYVDAFIVKFNSSGNCQWGTYYGGSNADYGGGISTDASGNIFVTGDTYSTTSIATAGAIQTTYGGNNFRDGFIVKFNASGVRQWGTYYGGSNDDIGYSITTDTSGNIMITGQTVSVSGIATIGAYQTAYGGSTDAYVAKFFDCLPPIINGVNDTIVCSGNPIVLNATSPATISWSNGVINNQPFLPQTTGYYIVTATDAIGCNYRDSVLVTVNPLPNVNAGVNQTVCEGTSVTLAATGATTYSWNNGVVNNLSFIPQNTQTYIVTGTDANNCSNTAQVQVTVNPLPTINVGADVSVCIGDNITLNAISNASNVSWNSGVVNNQSFTPTISGNYIATATSAQGCVNKDTVVVSINPFPNVNAAADQTLCIGNSTSLSATGAINYSWSGGVSNNQSFTPTTTNSYVVTGTDSNGCSNSDTVQVTVNPLPTANATTTNSVICPNGNATLTASGSINYLWSNGDTTATTTVNQVGSYYVIAANQYGCTDTSNIITVTQKTLPNQVKIKAVGATSVCEPNTVSFVLDMPLGSTTGFGYQWYLSGSPIVGATDSTFNANTTGSYALSVSGGDNCLKYATAKTATIKAAPVASFAATTATTICAGGLVTLVAPSISGCTYTWLKDGVAAGSGTTKSFKLAGNYTVIAKINGCSDTASPTIPIVVNPLPIASVTALNATTFCAGDSCILEASPVGAVSYEWHNSTFILDTTTTEQFKIGITATIKVLVKDANGCIGKLSATSVKTKANAVPLASISSNGSTTISSTGNVKLKATPSTGVTWQWFKDGNAISNATANSYIATAGGTYTVAITKLGCTGTSSGVVVTQTTPKENAVTTIDGSFEMSAYPNPVSEVLTVTISGLETIDGIIQVMDMSGKLITSKACHPEPVEGSSNTGFDKLSLTTDNWSSGVYLIRYKDDEGRRGTVKVVKE